MISPLLILLATSATVTVTGCPESGEVARLAELELGEAPEPASIRCTGDHAELKHGARTRTVDLSAVAPKAQARLLALALAELAGQIDPPPPPPSRPPPAPPPPAPPPVADRGGPDIEAAVEILGGLATFSAKSPFSFGGRAGFEVTSTGRFGGRLDVGATFGSGGIPGGSASMLALAGGLTGFVRLPAGALDVDVGAGGRLGWVRLSGEPEDPGASSGADVSGIWGGPHAAARLSIPFEALAFLLDLEAGLVLRPVVGRAEGTPVIAADGAWFAVHAGARFDL